MFGCFVCGACLRWNTPCLWDSQEIKGVLHLLHFAAASADCCTHQNLLLVLLLSRFLSTADCGLKWTYQCYIWQVFESALSRKYKIAHVADYPHTDGWAFRGTDLHFHSHAISPSCGLVSTVILSLIKGCRAWEQNCAPAVPLTTSDTQARITTFSPATSPWLLWVRKHDTKKNFSLPVKVFLCTQKGKQGREEPSNSFSLCSLIPIKVSQRKPGWKTWAETWAFTFMAVGGSGLCLIKTKLLGNHVRELFISSCDWVWFVDSVACGGGNCRLAIYGLMALGQSHAGSFHFISFQLQYWLFVTGKKPGALSQGTFSTLHAFYGSVSPQRDYFLLF